MIEKLGVTKWPWNARISKYGWMVTADECLICAAKKEQHVLKQTHDRQDKDARLIAAAPEMLEALVIMGMENTNYEKRHQNCRDIVEKVTGRTWAEVKQLLEVEEWVFKG